MYLEFDPSDRAQGIPPTGEDRIRNWLETIGEDSINVVARHDGDAIGHAMLVPDSDDPAAIERKSEIEWGAGDIRSAGLPAGRHRHALAREPAGPRKRHRD